MFGKRRIYLDWAAGAPVTRSAERAYLRASASFGNPSSPHAEGLAAKAVLEDARTRIARELSMKPDDVIFTAGATEANNLAIQGTVIAKKKAGMKDIHLLYLPSAHASVVEAMKSLVGYGVTAEPLKIRDGAVDIRALNEQLRPETALVSVDFVCGETGTIWNVREIGQALKQAGHGTLLHVDASQAPLGESIERTRLAADMITLDAQKVGGMRGLGVLAAPRTLRMEPLQHGGGQERGMRPGTQAPALAAAFATALEEARVCRESFRHRAGRMRGGLIACIRDIPELYINEGKEGVAHILNLSLPGRDTDYLAALLNEAGFAVSTRSACESESEDGSRAVLSLTGDPARAASTLRVSWGPVTRERELRQLGKALIAAAAFLDGSTA